VPPRAIAWRLRLLRPWATTATAPAGDRGWSLTSRFPTGASQNESIQVSSRSTQAAPASRTIDLSGDRRQPEERHSPYCGGWLTGHGLRRSRSPRLAPCPRSQGGQRCAARSSSGVAAVRRRTSLHAPGRSCSPLTVLDHVGPSLGSSGAPDAPPLPRISMRVASRSSRADNSGDADAGPVDGTTQEQSRWVKVRFPLVVRVPPRSSRGRAVPRVETFELSAAGEEPTGERPSPVAHPRLLP
jgi:hypothetical protein